MNSFPEYFAFSLSQSSTLRLLSCVLQAKASSRFDERVLFLSPILSRVFLANILSLVAYFHSHHFLLLSSTRFTHASFSFSLQIFSFFLFSSFPPSRASRLFLVVKIFKLFADFSRFSRNFSIRGIFLRFACFSIFSCIVNSRHF